MTMQNRKVYLIEKLLSFYFDAWNKEDMQIYIRNLSHGITDPFCDWTEDELTDEIAEFEYQDK